MLICTLLVLWPSVHKFINPVFMEPLILKLIQKTSLFDTLSLETQFYLFVVSQNNNIFVIPKKQ